MLQPVEKVHRFVQLVESRNIARRDIQIHTISIFFINRHFYLSLFSLSLCDANQGIIHRVIGPYIPLRLKNVLIISAVTLGLLTLLIHNLFEKKLPKSIKTFDHFTSLKNQEDKNELH